MPENIEVIKTLVIGLGTTGTNVCRGVAERVEWEYGSVERAPWIRYLCLETDGNTRRGPLPDEAMIHLSITSEEYAQVLSFARAYDEFMDLSLWADAETLKTIPEREVSSGAGNIRMIGRLSFLFPRNFRAVRNSIEGNMRALRLLDSAAAQEKLGKLPDGKTPAIAFRGGGALRIFVTGSLCGGTCSGLAADIGFLVGHIKQPDDKSIAVLGLPRPDLSNHLVDHAERNKVNAYSALTELNHYSLPQIEKPPIKAGSDVIHTTGVSPYELMYLAMPEATGKEAEARLTIAMADRIFLNSSVPDVDPFGNTADATIADRQGHAHVFSTFGIRTIEFPRQRVIEGCTKQLLLTALRVWSRPSSSEEVRSDAENAARAAGFHMQAMAAELQKTDKGQDIVRVLGDIVDSIGQSRSKADARQAVNYLRSVLGTGAATAGDGGLRAGDAPRWIQSCVEVVVRDRAQRVSEALAQVLLRRQGLHRASEVLRAVSSALDRLEQMKPVDMKTEMTATDGALDALTEGSCWWPPSGRKFAQGRDRLIAAAREELQVTLDGLTRAAVAAVGKGVAASDCVVARCRRALKPMQVRLGHLQQRVTYATSHLDQEVSSLMTTTPVLNGEAIFSTGQWEGTIGHWYRRELGLLKGDETRWEEAQADECSDVLSLWAELPAALRPGAGHDWLADDVDPDARDLIPAGILARLLDRARQPFDKLRSRSVTDELVQQSNMRELLLRACDRGRELVFVDEALATQGGRSPIPGSTLLLRPGADSDVDRVVRSAINDDVKTVSSPDTSRILLLRERYRFPLYGAPSIVSGCNSLAQATCCDFTTFHTRKDVFWTGLSSVEHEARREAEEALVVAILLGVAPLVQGSIWVNTHRTKPGDPDRLPLPFSLSHASRVLNPYRAGALTGEGNSPLLRQLTDQVKRLQEVENAEAFVRRLTTAFDEGTGRQLPDWKAVAGDAVRRYCTRDDRLYSAFRTVFPPSVDRVARMRKQAGTARPIGGTYRKDGLYCLDPTCCGWVGEDDRDAAKNGWRCFICGKDCEQN